MMPILYRKKSYLDERHSHRILLYVAFDCVAHSHNKLVRHHKDQDVDSFHRLHQVWNGQLRKRETNNGNKPNQVFLHFKTILMDIRFVLSFLEWV